MIARRRALQQCQLEYDEECAEAKIMTEFFVQLDAERAQARADAEQRALEAAAEARRQRERNCVHDSLRTLFRAFRAFGLCPPDPVSPEEAAAAAAASKAKGKGTRPATAKKK